MKIMYRLQFFLLIGLQFIVSYEHLIQTGNTPHYTKLGKMLNVQPDEARQLQNKATKAGVGCWLASQTDYIESWAFVARAKGN